ncbi:hypothetical protein D3C76_1702820 [compost metagenome]
MALRSLADQLWITDSNVSAGELPGGDSVQPMIQKPRQVIAVNNSPDQRLGWVETGIDHLGGNMFGFESIHRLPIPASLASRATDCWISGDGV